MANGQAGRCQEMKSGCKSTKWSNTKINIQNYKMVKHMSKQTKEQNDQAQK